MIAKTHNQSMYLATLVPMHRPYIKGRRKNGWKIQTLSKLPWLSWFITYYCLFIKPSPGGANSQSLQW